MGLGERVTVAHTSGNVPPHTANTQSFRAGAASYPTVTPGLAQYAGQHPRQDKAFYEKLPSTLISQFDAQKSSSTLKWIQVLSVKCN
jgi:hypothetical protein